MKMSLGCCYMLLLLLVFIAVVSGVVVNEKKKVGSKAFFKPDITAASSLKDSSITWKYTRGSDVIKVIEWDNDFKTLEVLNPKFIDRVALDKTTGELTIKTLKLDDTGSYSIEINNKEEKKISLTVMEGVPKPTLKHEETRGDGIYLNCNYKTLINWTCSEGKNPVFLNSSKGAQGESVTISRTKNLDVCCNCTLYNEVDQETSNTLCVKDLLSDPGNPGEIGLGIGIFIIISILLFIPIILLYLCVKPVYNYVHPRCENKPCIGGIVNSLEKFRRKETSEPQSNNTNGSPEPAQAPNKDPLLKKDEDDKL